MPTGPHSRQPDWRSDLGFAAGWTAGFYSSQSPSLTDQNRGTPIPL